MERSSRRKFIKQATMSVAALGPVAVAVTGGKAAGKPKSASTQLLYRETIEWKKYYESLR